jgi:LacI family transcriptional regulator
MVALSTEGRQPGVPRVVADCVEIGRRAAFYFLGLGIKRCAFAADPRMSYARSWQRGLVTEMHRSGGRCTIIPMPEALLFPTENAQEVAARLDAALPELDFPCGIFAKDLLAAHVLLSAKRLGIIVPEQLSVLGAGYSDLLAMTCFPPLTTIDYPGERTGYEAAATLDGLLSQSGPVPRHVIVAGCELQERESTAEVLGFSGAIRDALRYIQEQAPRVPLTAAQVEDRFAPGSASVFRIHFRTQTGATLKETILRTRLARLEQQLLETRLSVKEIASDMGFSSPEELARFLKRTRQTTPTRFRLAGLAPDHSRDASGLLAATPSPKDATVSA